MRVLYLFLSGGYPVHDMTQDRIRSDQIGRVGRVVDQSVLELRGLKTDKLGSVT